MLDPVVKDTKEKLNKSNYTVMYANGAVEGRTVKVIVDSGAALTVISSKFARLLGKEVKRDNLVEINAAAGGSIKSVGG